LDVQRGILAPTQAASKRQDLALEIQFYGRITGAIQFIKGDSIASLVVAGINIVGGLIVGTVVPHPALPQAAETYTLLSFRAGLGSQLPGTLGSVAASILISRVSPDEAKEGLGPDVFKQILRTPMALVLGSLSLFIFGLIPGMPTVSVAALAVAMAFIGIKQL